MLDPDLMKACTEKAERVLELERQTDQAKADYHFAIRRLHLEGGSLREIGAALGLSHQRVSQIVNADNRTWFRRWLDPGVSEKRLTCSFCGRSSQKAAKLVAGPRVYICDKCIQAVQRVFATGEDAAKLTLFDSSAKRRCSFCGQRTDRKRQLAGTAKDGICSECIGLAKELAGQDGEIA